MPDVEGLEASVGIVTLGDLDADASGPRVAEAAAQLGASSTGRRRLLCRATSGSTRYGTWVASAITVEERTMPA